MEKSPEAQAIVARILEVGDADHDVRTLAIDVCEHLRQPYAPAGYLILDALRGNLVEAIDLTQMLLPGWVYKVCRCHVSDDAWLAPDYNDPEHSARLYAELGEPKFGHPFDHGVDVAIAPPDGAYPAKALLIAVIEAMDLVRQRARELETVGA